MPEDEKCCKHNYQHMDTVKREVSSPYGHYITLKRIDLFYCTKCLTVKDSIREKQHRSFDEYPNWW